MSDLNPYAAPLDASYSLPGSTSGTYFSEGVFLRVQDQAELPMFCILTGEPLQPQDWRKRVAIAWSPQWIWVGLFFGLLPVLLLMLVTQKRAKITYGLSQNGRKRIARKKRIATGLLLGGILLIVLAATFDNQTTFILGVTGGLMALLSLFLFVLANPIKPAGYDKGWFRLRGASPQFLQALPPFPYANAREIPQPVKSR